MKHCKDCSYCNIKETTTSSCKVKTTMLCDPEKTIKQDWIGNVIEFDREKLCRCEVDMKGDNCPYYKRKWYKFWI